MRSLTIGKLLKLLLAGRLVFVVMGCADPATETLVEQSTGHCAKVSACTGMDLNTCVLLGSHPALLTLPGRAAPGTHEAELLREYLDCVDQAQDCDTVSACVQHTEPDSLCRGDKASRCEGEVWMSCEHTDEATVEIRAEDCAEQGLICQDGYGCREPAAPCTADLCDDDALVLCLDGHEDVVDCAEVHGEFTCDAQGETPSCRMPADEVECATDGATFCDGTTAHLCLRGKIMAVDCGGFQGGTCASAYFGDAIRCELPR